MRKPDAEPAGPRMSAYETLRVIERHLLGKPEALLAETVELHDMARSTLISGRDAVGAYLHDIRKSVVNSAVTEPRLTVDEGRAAAEWVLRRRAANGDQAAPMACFYGVSAGRIDTIRLYYDATSLDGVRRGRSG